MNPMFLDLGWVIRIHRSMIEHYGGDDGIRDIGLLQSAVTVPQASFGGKYLHVDLYEMAAAYLYHIVQDHPFVDGNKRTGAAGAIVFLELNGVLIEPDEDSLVELTLNVAKGTIGKKEVADFFRQHAE